MDATEAALAASLGILAEAFLKWPDVVIVISAAFTPHDIYDVLRARQMRTVIIHTEAPYEDDRQISISAHADLNLVNDPTNIDRYREFARTEYIPHAYDPLVHRPFLTDLTKKSDVCFIGTGFKERREFLEQCDWSGMDFKLAGQWAIEPDNPLWPHLIAKDNPQFCIDNAQTVGYYQSAKASFNIYRSTANMPELADGWAMGPREVELAATGCFFARDPRPEGDELFPMLPPFTSPGELTDILRHYLANDSARENAAEKARAAVADRTFENHARQLLRWLEQ